MLVGLVFAVPALRTRGVQLAVVTLGLGLSTQSVVFNNGSYVGGIEGTTVPSPRLFGLNIDPNMHPEAYGIVVWVLFVLAGLVVANIRRGRSGRRMLAVRANERAAAASGISVVGTKLHAFAIAGALAGLGGALLGLASTTVTFDSQFNPIASIIAVAGAVIGGIGFIAGSFFGGGFSPASWGSIISIHLPGFQFWPPVIGAVGMLEVLIVHPAGIAGGLSRPFGRARAKLLDRGRTERTIQPPSATPARVAPKALVVEGMTVRYGGVVAVNDLSLRVEPGEIVALIGPNGAGKTSFMDATTGFAPASGRVLLGDESVDGWPAARRARAGMVRSFQGLELFEDMTIRENIQAASDRWTRRALVTDLVRPGRSMLSPAALAAVAEFGLGAHLDALPEHLSQGQRRLVAIARAVAMEPSVLLLDEPVAGLDDTETAEFGTLVRRLADVWGMAVLVVEHDMSFVMEISDRVVVMDFGNHVTEGTPTEVRQNPAAIAAYLGVESDDADGSGAVGTSMPEKAVRQ